MDSVLRVVVIFGFLLLLLRLAGRRTLAEMTSFDFVLLLIVSEQTQQAMVGQDHSMMNAFLMITTLIGLDIGFSLVKQRWPWAEKLLDGTPTIIVENGRPIRSLMDRARVDVDDVLSAAREKLGLERLDQIKYAVLEKSGGISIIPYR
jgi:uncharacterized membrane protein YcaP (DUF421 family)